MKFRPLNADEIDVRVGGNIGADKIYLLLYKDARCDMRILDETVGAGNWQRKHYECKGNLFCSVGIYDETKNEWVWKDDCGTESNTEKEKGESSDSFKRACFNWGIGRELYTAPDIKIAKANLKYSPDGKYLWSKLRVKDIEYADNAIIRLCICDENGDDKYTYGYPRKKKATDEFVCEGCGNPLTAVMGEDGKFIPIGKIAEISKEVTKKNYGEEHILCSVCLKDKEVLKRVINGHKG